MILLGIASGLLFFITYFTGRCTLRALENYTGYALAIDFFETFIYGLITSFVYFSIVSFILPVNFWVLVPLLLLSLFTFFSTREKKHLLDGLKQNSRLFFSKKNIFYSIPFIILIFIYWIIPPLNADSGEYHYIAIRWFERFKIVPGLGNVHGRLAFNPASFIISAPYSFTGITGQALYPLNGLLVLLFYAWLLKKIFAAGNNLYGFILLILSIILFRISLINVSSPSSDLLAGMLLFYIGLRTYELIKSNAAAFPDYLQVLIFACFAVTAKLSAIPGLLVLPFIYFVLLKKERKLPLVVKYISLAAVIIVPWLVRNFVLSGYLLYPIPSTGFFNADWKVPADVIKLDFLYSKYGPRTITVDFFTMQKMDTVQLVKVWYDYMRSSSMSSLLLTAAAFLSIFIWLGFPLLKQKFPWKIFILWSIYFLCAAIWFFNSPEHRFGLPYLTLLMGLPLLALFKKIFVNIKLNPVFAYLLLLFCTVHYALGPVDMRGMYAFSLKDCWWKPLRDKRYITNSKYLETFPSVPLGNGVTLYKSDSRHDCLNVEGPCMNWWYGEIEMRGNTITDGFRNTKDEVKKYFPFVDVH